MIDECKKQIAKIGPNSDPRKNFSFSFKSQFLVNNGN